MFRRAVSIQGRTLRVVGKNRPGLHTMLNHGGRVGDGPGGSILAHCLGRAELATLSGLSASELSTWARGR